MIFTKDVAPERTSLEAVKRFSPIHDAMAEKKDEESMIR
jgi:hypothetical protein